jgi:hypothetical protein
VIVMRVPALAFFLCILAVPALAASPQSAPAAKEGAPGTNVEMPYLMAPMTGSDGKLYGYAYISTRLTATSATEALDIRDRIAFIQDAFVRDVNNSSIAKASDPLVVDDWALETRLVADARRVMGPGKVASIAIVQLQVAPLHPNPTVTPSAMPSPDVAPTGTAAKTP